MVLTILRLIVLYIVVKLIWGVITTLFSSFLSTPNNDTVTSRPRPRPSFWDQVDKNKLEDADFTEIE